MTCKTKECTAVATCLPKLCVPAMYWPIDAHTPLESVLCVPMCEPCAGAMKATDFFSDGPSDLRPVFEFLARGKLPPDFKRAFITTIALDSPQAKKYLEQAAK